MVATLVWGPAGATAPVISNIIPSESPAGTIEVSWDLDQFAQGWLEYGTSPGGPYPLETIHETSFDYDSHTQSITGLGSLETIYFRVVAVNVAGQTTRSGEQVFTTADSSVAVASMYEPTVYGTGNSDSRANQRVPNDAALISIRFIASVSSALNTFQWQARGGSGYSLGTGGTYRWYLRSDNGGNPDTTLATADDYSPGNPAGSWEKFVTATFSTPYTVTAGTTYHLVMENVAASPSSNCISINASFTYSTLTPRQPRYTSDFAQMRYNGSSWSVMGQYTPDVEIAYADGTFDGYGWNGIMIDHVRTITGTTNMVRELFTAARTMTVTGVAMRVGRQTGTGLLTLSLYQGGSILAFGTCSDSGSSVGLTTPGGTGPQGTWVHLAFGAAQTLVAGTQYSVRASCDSSTQYSATGLAGGINGPSGYLRSPNFAEGVAQYTTNGGSTWSAFYGGFSSPGHVNTQMYLTVAP